MLLLSFVFYVLAFVNSSHSVILDRRLIGSTKLNLSQYPFFVHLSTDSIDCGGASYTEDIVLTAQHCARYPKSHYTVYKNLTSFKDMNSPEVSKHKVIAIKNHPDLTKRYISHNDISIMKLDIPVNKERLFKLDLHGLGNEGGLNLKVFGWNRRTDHIAIPIYDFPQEASLIVQNPEQCLKDYERKGKLSKRVTIGNKFKYVEVDLDNDINEYRAYNFDKEVEICTSTSKDLFRGTESGDSGSPAIYVYNDEPILVGLVSWGDYKDPQESRISVLVKISKFASWIDETVDSLHYEYKETTYFKDFFKSVQNSFGFME